MVWSRPSAALIEFPAVVDDGVAFVTNYQRQRPRLLDAERRDASGAATLGGMMAASPAVAGDELVVHGMDGHVWVLEPPQRARALALRRPARRSSPRRSCSNGVDYFGDWGGTVYALDLRTHRARWTYRSGYKITSSASYANGTIFIGDYGGRLLALARAQRRPALVGLASTAASTGRPRSRTAASSSPSSTGGSLTAFSTERRAAVVARHRLVRLLVARGLERARLLRLLQRRPLLRSRRADGRDRSGASRPAGAIAGAPTIVDGVVYFSNRQHRIYGVTRADRQAGLPLPRRRLRARSPGTGAGCSCTASRGSTRSSPGTDEEGPARGAARPSCSSPPAWSSYGLYRKHQGRDVRGSSTGRVRHHPAAAEAASRRRATRSSGRCTASTRRGRATPEEMPARSGRRSGRSGSSAPARSSSSRPSLAYGHLYFANAKGTLFAVDTEAPGT